MANEKQQPQRQGQGFEPRKGFEEQQPRRQGQGQREQQQPNRQKEDR